MRAQEVDKNSDYDIDYFSRCALNKKVSEAIRNAGYRKQSDTVREFVKKLDKDWIEVTTKEYGTFYAVSDERIQELAKEYGVEDIE